MMGYNKLVENYTEVFVVIWFILSIRREWMETEYVRK